VDARLDRGGAIFVDRPGATPTGDRLQVVDVPDLGYFHTDRPHPRGELLVMSDTLFPGYYKRPEVIRRGVRADGYYRPDDHRRRGRSDQLVYLDRRNNVLKLSQGEFVTVSKLEAVFR